jgi:hypothetical protein
MCQKVPNYIQIVQMICLSDFSIYELSDTKASRNDLYRNMFISKVGKVAPPTLLPEKGRPMPPFVPPPYMGIPPQYLPPKSHYGNGVSC